MANDEEHTPDFEDLLAAYDISDASIESSNLRNGGNDHHRGASAAINVNFLKEMAFAETQSEACKRAIPFAASVPPSVEITVIENGAFDVRKKPITSSNQGYFNMQRSILDLGQAKQAKPKSARKNISASCSRPLVVPIQKELKTTVVKARKTVKTLDPKPRENQTVYKKPAAVDNGSKRAGFVQPPKRPSFVQPSTSFQGNGTERKEQEESVMGDDDDELTEDVTNQLYTNALPPYSPKSDTIEPDRVWANAPTEGGFTCLDCGDRFLLESSLVGHLQRRSVQIALNCSSCGEKQLFHNRCALLSHVRIHREKNENVDLSNTSFGPLSTKDLVGRVDETKATVVIEKPNQSELNSTYRCHECQRYCGSSLSLREHFGCSRNQPSKQIRCEQCNMPCLSKCSLKSHWRIHLQDKPFVCPECGQVISENWDVFHLHLTTVCLHLSRTIGFKCTVCDALTVTAVELIDHIVQCHNQSYYKCKECPMAFKSAISFNAHGMSVHKTTDVQCLTIRKCPLCDVVFQNMGGLKMHLETHVSDLNKKIQFLFRCTVCRVLFKDKTTLGDHLKQTHPSIFKVRCKICRSAFRDRNLLREHKLRKHPELMTEDDMEDSASTTTTTLDEAQRQALANEAERMEYEESILEEKMAEETSSNVEVKVPEIVSLNVPNNTMCKQCDRSFESIQKLRIHRRRIHTSQLIRHRCAVCQEYHPEQGSMTRHGHIHLDEGLHVCTLCNNLAFATKLGLSRHIDHHATNYSYPLDCVYCGRNLINFTTAADHWKSEHHVYDYSCDKCDAQFLHVNGLNRHKRRMHRAVGRTKYYPCSICEGFEFPKRSSLVQHLESVHGISSVDIDLSQLIPTQNSSNRSRKVVTIVQTQPPPPPPPSLPPPPSSPPPPLKIKILTIRKDRKPPSEDDEPIRKSRKKSKRSEEVDEKEVETEQTGDGHFCAKCGYAAKNKSQFLEHIKVHKTERNLYQCLECGICFVVEPSLRKHLSFTHKVKDIERFMEENGYLAKGGQLLGGPQRNHNGTPGPSTSSSAKSTASAATPMDLDPSSLQNVPSSDKVFECEVCFNTFETDLSLRTHMRTHGMAFIKIKRISNVPINEVHRSKPQAQSETP